MTGQLIVKMSGSVTVIELSVTFPVFVTRYVKVTFAPTNSSGVTPSARSIAVGCSGSSAFTALTIEICGATPKT